MSFHVISVLPSIIPPLLQGPLHPILESMAPEWLTNWKTPRKSFGLQHKKILQECSLESFKAWDLLWKSTDIHSIHSSLGCCSSERTKDFSTEHSLWQLPEHLAKPGSALPPAPPLPGHCWTWLRLTWEQQLLQHVELTAGGCWLEHGQTQESSWKPLGKKVLEELKSLSRTGAGSAATADRNPASSPHAWSWSHCLCSGCVPTAPWANTAPGCCNATPPSSSHTGWWLLLGPSAGPAGWPGCRDILGIRLQWLMAGLAYIATKLQPF